MPEKLGDVFKAGIISNPHALNNAVLYQRSNGSVDSVNTDWKLTHFNSRFASQRIENPPTVAESGHEFYPARSFQCHYSINVVTTKNLHRRAVLWIQIQWAHSRYWVSQRCILRRNRFYLMFEEAWNFFLANPRLSIPPTKKTEKQSCR